jgi:hypothetical protein
MDRFHNFLQNLKDRSHHMSLGGKLSQELCCCQLLLLPEHTQVLEQSCNTWGQSLHDDPDRFDISVHKQGKVRPLEECGLFMSCSKQLIPGLESTVCT